MSYTVYVLLQYATWVLAIVALIQLYIILYQSNRIKRSATFLVRARRRLNAKRKMIASLADRVAMQAEILTRKAGKK